MKNFIVIFALALCMLGCAKDSENAEINETLRQSFQEQIDRISRGEKDFANGIPLTLNCTVNKSTRYDINSNKDNIAYISYNFGCESYDEEVSIREHFDVDLPIGLTIDGDFLKAKRNLDMTTASVEIYNQNNEIVNRGRILLEIFTGSDVKGLNWKSARYVEYYYSGLDKVRLSDNVELLDIIYALSKPGWIVKIKVAGEFVKPVIDATLIADKRLERIKVLQQKQQEENERMKIEAEKLAREQAALEQAKREAEERAKVEREAHEKKMKAIRTLTKEIEDTQKMIDVAVSNGYNKAAEKYRKELKKLETKLETIQ